MADIIKILHKGNSATISMDVPLVLFEEDDIFYANLPSLDILGYGNNQEEAISSLDEMVNTYFQYTIENNKQ
ncbi:MAG: hypothetical protein IPO86_10025 [Saprospiraceae bacterium]|nr:hypothetical protein [Saprospiraceae bacterium]